MTSTNPHQGVCHCGAIGYRYRTALAPESWMIRACQCSFCRTHAALSTSDPQGSLEFIEYTPQTLHRYQFGYKTADFLLCRNCGAYIGAAVQTEGRRFGVINVRVLQSLAGQLQEAVPMHYEGEGLAERLARRISRWTPVVGP